MSQNYNYIVGSQAGALLGMNLIHIKRKNIDPDYSNKQRDGLQRLANEVHLVGIERLRVTKAELVNTGDEWVVQFNDNPKLQISLLGAKDIKDIIKKPTVAAVAEAMQKEESSSIITWFVDDVSATEIAASFNERARKQLSMMMEAISIQCGNLKQANEIMFDSCKQEMEQIGQKVTFQSVTIVD